MGSCKRRAATAKKRTRVERWSPQDALEAQPESWKTMSGHFKTTGMRRTTSRRSIRLHRGQNGRRTKIFGFVYHDTSGPNLRQTSKTQWFLLSGICTVILWQDYYGIPMWECLFVHRKQGLFLSVQVDDITLAGRKQNLNPMWKKLMK